MTARRGTAGAEHIFCVAGGDDGLYMHFWGQTQGADALHVFHMDRIRTANHQARRESLLRPPADTISLSEWAKRGADDSDGSACNPPPSPWPTAADCLAPDDAGDETSLRRSRRYSRRIEESSRFGAWTLVLLLLAVVMVTLTAVYSTGSAKALMRGKIFTTSSSNAILVLRILTELCALILTALAVVVVEDLQWALASRPGGVGLLHFIGLDTGTGVWGLVRLLATADWRQKYSSLLRLLVLCCIPLPGIILMGDINIELVFFPQHTYEVAAGLGDFNASLISQLTNATTTALLVQMGNPIWSDREVRSMEPLGRRQGHCTSTSNAKDWTPCEESYFMSGGFNSISPQSDDLRSYPESDAYVVPNLKGYHVEYGKVHDLENLRLNGSCHTIGNAGAAAYWCSSTGPSQELLFGSSYCPISLQLNNSCLNTTTWTKSLELATSMFVYRRNATVNFSRNNFSILSVTNLSKPVPYPIKLQDYMLALSAVVPGFNSSSDSGSGDNSALAIYAVTALPINDSEVAKKISLKAIRKAMSVPLDYFHKNYFSGGAPIWELKTPRAGLPSDMYTNMSIAVMSHQVVAGQVSRWLFLAFACSLLALSAAAILVTARICERRPQRCGYPTLDFAAVCAKGSACEAGHENGLHRSLTTLGEQPSKFEVASKIKHERIVLR